MRRTPRRTSSFSKERLSAKRKFIRSPNVVSWQQACNAEDPQKAAVRISTFTRLKILCPDASCERSIRPELVFLGASEQVKRARQRPIGLQLSPSSTVRSLRGLRALHFAGYTVKVAVSLGIIRTSSSVSDTGGHSWEISESLLLVVLPRPELSPTEAEMPQPSKRSTTRRWRWGRNRSEQGLHFWIATRIDPLKCAGLQNGAKNGRGVHS